MIIRPYANDDVCAMRAIWNEVVEAGQAFPQLEPLTEAAAEAFFAEQSRTAVALDDGVVRGLYILHPNNVGRCGHIANASFAVTADARGQGIGRALVVDALRALAPLGFRGLQFNAVVAANARAIRLYESLGFRRVGTIADGFRTDDGFVDIHIYYHDADTMETAP